MNTKRNGKVRFLIFKEDKSDLYTGVCLDFGIVIQDESKDFVEKELLEASKGYLETIIKAKLNDELLNNQAEKEYFDLYRLFLEKELNPESLKKDFMPNYSDMNFGFVGINSLICHCNA